MEVFGGTILRWDLVAGAVEDFYSQGLPFRVQIVMVVEEAYHQKIHLHHVFRSEGSQASAARFATLPRHFPSCVS